ncbi:MAG TPA: ABC transporter [Lentisphaeria bacterium]|nr:MAG: hypothetical protein A2X45_19535 [Lentisphaerae bacterium GWF2_50_93]HCE43645.1 ABC transporter [Lentisphaeria bacterium]
MKLIRLKLNSQFRSLHPGFELHFMNDWELAEFSGQESNAPYVLAGPNGSGKSNILEVLASIFYHLECTVLQNLPDSFIFDEEENPEGFQSSRCSPDAFELEYFTPAKEQFPVKGFGNLARVLVRKEAKKNPQWSVLNATKSISPLERENIRDLLPAFVLGYSSGENEILSLPFFKMRFIQYDEYLECLKKELSYPGEPESRLTFLDQEFSQAILLCNLLMQDENALSPLKSETKVKDLQKFRVIFNRRMELSPMEAEDFPKSILIEETDEIGSKHLFLPILKLFESEKTESDHFVPAINRLIRCATCNYHDKESDTLYLDYWVNDATKDAFRSNFSSAIELFQTFQVLFNLNLYSVSKQLKKELYTSESLYVNETVPSLPSDRRIIRFKDFWITKTDTSKPLLCKMLSDGEHQILHSLGLCLLYRENNCLYLLDEPETHLNPDWRSQFITSLKKCLGENNMHVEVMITTHAPFLISDCEPQNVLVFNKDEGPVSVTNPDYNTLGASINKITMTTFGKRETIGGQAQAIINDLRQRFKNGEDKKQIIDEINQKLGDSVEKVLMIKTILDSMEEKD